MELNVADARRTDMEGSGHASRRPDLIGIGYDRLGYATSCDAATSLHGRGRASARPLSLAAIHTVFLSVWITSVLPARESVCSRFVSLLAGTM